MRILDERKRELEAAYIATDYVVHAEPPIVIKVGHLCRPLEALLLQHKVRSWAFITACNPGSLQLSDIDNSVRMNDLAKLVKAAGFRLLRGKGMIADGSWPPEPSLLILGIDEAQSSRLAAQFGQLAFIYGDQGSSAKLLWISRP